MDHVELNLNHLVHFHVVTATPSLKAAGRRLHLSPSTLSEQMRALEQAVGKPLFDRAGGRLEPNENGRKLVRHTTKLLSWRDELLRDFDLDVQGTPSPLVTVGVTTAVSNAFAAERILPLLRSEDLHVRVLHGEHGALLRKLLEHELDLLFTEEAPAVFEGDSVRSRELARPGLVAVCAPKLAQDRLDGDPWPQALGRLPLLTFTVSSPYRRQVDAFLAGHGLDAQLVGETDDLGMLRAAVKRGVAAVFLPEHAFGDANLDAEGERLQVLGRLPSAGTLRALYSFYEPPARVMEAIDALFQGDDGA